MPAISHPSSRKHDIFVAFAFLFSTLLFFPLPLLAETPANNDAGEKNEGGEQADGFEKTWQPFLKRYCLKCHGGDGENGKDAKSEVDFRKYKNAADIEEDRAVWEKTLEMLEFGAMPPEDQPQPEDGQREAVVGWLESRLFQIDCDQKVDPGRVTIRRLNRTEYNNTIRDWLGVSIRPADDFPSDDVGEGFDNIGDVLTLSPLLMEKYLNAAEAVAAEAIYVPRAPYVEKNQLEAKKMQIKGAARRVGGGRFAMASNGQVLANFDVKTGGQVTLRVRAAADQAGDELAKMEVRVDGKSVKTHQVKGRRPQANWYEHTMRLKAGKHRIAAGFINDFYNPKAKDPKQRDRNLYIGAIEIAYQVNPKRPAAAAKLRKIITVSPGKGRSVRQAAEKVIVPLANRAFRHRVSAKEAEPYVRLVELAVNRGESFDRGVQVALTGLLVSPHFLFRVERHPTPNDPQAKHIINDFELASRLSYFLWSSMPDDRLFRLASKGALRNRKTLREEVARMLQDDRAEALVENFGGQWLNLRNLADIAPDPKQFPGFDHELRQAMQRETELFFREIVREDRSVLDFIDGEFTYLNGRLAKHYNIKGVTGGEFQRVSLKNTPRSGVLTHASILTLTSNPTRTSPVKRGKWIMENILGTPPPVPPDNVPEIEEAQKAKPNATFRQQLELHRKDPNCATCHRQMDALGFGFENFDAIGRWRDLEGKLKIDASGELPDGGVFNGPRELVQLLRARKDDFTRMFVERMLVYSLGRGLQFYDQCAVDKILVEAGKSDFRFTAVVNAIVTSEPFLIRRGEKAE